jgi:hypothetical protein
MAENPLTPHQSRSFQFVGALAMARTLISGGLLLFWGSPFPSNEAGRILYGLVAAGLAAEVGYGARAWRERRAS